MNKLLTILTFLFVFPALAASAPPTTPTTTPPVDQITLTTYYPAPFGAYDQFRLVPRDALAGTCQDGTLYVRNSDSAIQYCSSGVWGGLTGVWNKIDGGRMDPYNPTTDVDQYYLNTPYPNLNVRKPYIGIGTQDPQRPLHIQINDSGTPSTVVIDNVNTSPGTGACLSFRGTSTGAGGGDFTEFVSLQANYEVLNYATSRSYLGVFLRDGSGGGRKEQVRFQGNGYVGIRDSNPNALLEVSARGATTDPYLMLSRTDAGNGNVMIVTQDGRVGINRTAPGHLLDVNGNIRATTLILTSDGGLKKEIQPVNNALDKISQLRGVSFEWKDDSANIDRKHMGVIAQEVETVFPEVVYGKDGDKAVDYPSLIAPMIEAIKELKTSNETLKQKLESQETLIKTQEERIHALQGMQGTQ